MERRRRLKRRKLTRDMVTFSVGVGILLHQTLVAVQVSDQLVTAALVLMAGAAAARVDTIAAAKKRESKDDVVD